MSLSEYDRVLAISRDGTYRIIGPEEKFLIPGKAIYIDRFDPEEGARFTVVYRDAGRIAWAKKIHIRAYTRNREYELIKGGKGRIDLLLPGDAADIIHLDFVPAKRQRVHEARFDLSILEFVGPSARGRRMAPKPVLKLRKLRKSELEAAPATESVPEAPVEDSQPSLFDEE